MSAVEVPTDIPTPAARADHLFRRLLRNPLDVMGLGRDTAINLGVRHQRVTVWVLFLVSVLIAASTALCAWNSAG